MRSNLKLESETSDASKLFGRRIGIVNMMIRKLLNLARPILLKQVLNRHESSACLHSKKHAWRELRTRLNASMKE